MSSALGWLMLSETGKWVESWLREANRPGETGIVDVSDADVHPGGMLVACSVEIRVDSDAPPRRRLAIVGGDREGFRLVEVDYDECTQPKWSPDGARIAVLARSEPGETRAIVIDPHDPDTVLEMPPADGVVECCRWSRDGSRLALLVADQDAEVSDVYGSGLVASPESSWAPRVLPSVAGRRSLAIWDVESSQLRKVTSDNLWEVDWAGDGSLVALTSIGAGEGAWYDARLSLIRIDGSSQVLHTPRHQLAQPLGSPDGRQWSVIAGAASDRGLLAGSILVGLYGSEPAELDVNGVHVTDHAWLDNDRIAFAGLRGLDTVIGTVGVSSSEVDVVWSGSQTTGKYTPQVACSADSIWAILESHLRPPALGRFERGEFRPIAKVAYPGSSWVARHTGRTERMTWTSSDGTEIQGLLTRPDEEAPNALVVLAHGGPVFAWRDGWMGRDPYTSLLVARGYAVLRPNPRGSFGRGAEFAEAVIGDMGGRDVDDVLTGVQVLIDRGVVDSRRVGITGNSYGGYLAAWMPCRTDAFAAAVARSPVTDWVTQHYTSNLAEFDGRMLRGDVADPESQYVRRSPFRLHDRMKTPLLLTAGLHDLATPASQAQLLHQALSERGVESSLAIYPEEGHGVHHPAALADQCARMVAWFERFMPPSPS